MRSVYQARCIASEETYDFFSYYDVDFFNGSRLYYTIMTILSIFVCRRGVAYNN